MVRHPTTRHPGTMDTARGGCSLPAMSPSPVGSLRLRAALLPLLALTGCVSLRLHDLRAAVPGSEGPLEITCEAHDPDVRRLSASLAARYREGWRLAGAGEETTSYLLFSTARPVVCLERRGSSVVPVSPPDEPARGDADDILAPSFEESEGGRAGDGRRGPGSPPSERDVDRALELLKPSLSPCWNRSGITSDLSVVITVAPSGRIASVVLLEDADDTLSMACVRQKLGEARFTPFEGRPARFSRKLSPP